MMLNVGNIDIFNETINGNSGFNNHTIFQDIESDFNGVYSRCEKKLKMIYQKKLMNLLRCKI